MKKEIKNGLLIIGMLVTVSSFATEPSVTPSILDGSATEFPIYYVKKGQKLTITNSYGVVVYREYIEQSGIYTQKGFDLTQLMNGNYLIELEKELQIQITPFCVTRNIVVFSKEKEVTIFKPFVVTKNHKLYLSKLTLEQDPLTIDIYYDDPSGFTNYEKIYSEKIENTKVIERIYALDKEKKGTYKVLMKANGREYAQTFSL